MKYERELWGKNGFAIIVLSLGLHTLDPQLSPRLTPAEIFQHKCRVVKKILKISDQFSRHFSKF
jgi:hypothetical protein